MILDLTTHFPEKYVYKNPKQREAWGSHSIYISIYLSLDDSRILPDYPKESSWRRFFLRGKGTTNTEHDIQDREALPYNL